MKAAMVDTVAAADDEAADGFSGLGQLDSFRPTLTAAVQMSFYCRLEAGSQLSSAEVQQISCHVNQALQLSGIAA